MAFRDLVSLPPFLQPSLDGERGGLGPHSLIGTPDPAQPPRAQSTVTETGGEGTTAGRKPGTPHSKGLEAGGGRKEVGPQSVQPLPYGVGHFRPCFPKSHRSWLQNCPVPMEDEGGGSLRIGRVCREPCRHSVSPNSSLRARGPNSEPHPPCILGEDRALLVSFPLRSPGTAPMKCRHPCLPLPLPRGQQGG